MLDLKIVEEDQYDLVPVPLPGRLIVFAGPDGLMCRRNDGTIANYPAAAGGGGDQAFIDLRLCDGGLDFLEYPSPPEYGAMGRLFLTPSGVRMIMNDGRMLPQDVPVRWVALAAAQNIDDLPIPAAGGLTLAVSQGAQGGKLVVRDEFGIVRGVDNLDGVFFDPNTP